MNENIKELINKVETDVSGKWVYFDNMELFAKLIIQDCIEIVKKRAEDRPYICSDIKQHFGVEDE